MLLPWRCPGILCPLAIIVLPYARAAVVIIIVALSTLSKTTVGCRVGQCIGAAVMFLASLWGARTAPYNVGLANTAGPLLSIVSCVAAVINTVGGGDDGTSVVVAVALVGATLIVVVSVVLVLNLTLLRVERRLRDAAYDQKLPDQRITSVTIAAPHPLSQLRNPLEERPYVHRYERLC